MEYIDLRKLSLGELKQVRSQVVRLKKMGKSGKEIEEITGVRQNRASEIWTAYQRKGEQAFERKPGGGVKGQGRRLTPEEEEAIRETIIHRVPEEFGLPGHLWTLKKVCFPHVLTYLLQHPQMTRQAKFFRNPVDDCLPDSFFLFRRQTPPLAFYVPTGLPL